ncbi:transcription initiation protein [Chloroflexi bacterium TSY]|nr:transcription initiation protein [Chloroflexi bacterium TSY]
MANAQNQLFDTKKYLIIIRGAAPKSKSPEQMQQALLAYKNWIAQLGEKYIDGQRLEEHGVFVKNKCTIMTDGPFLESKEIIAGYIIVEANNLEEAIHIAKECPLIDDYVLEVRPILDIPN